MIEDAKTLLYNLKDQGEMSEWFKVTISKVVVGVTPPGVRIPAFPNKKLTSKAC